MSDLKNTTTKFDNQFHGNHLASLAQNVISDVCVWYVHCVSASSIGQEVASDISKHQFETKFD